MAKTKTSKLWLSMVVVFLVILNVSYVEAKSLRKGEEYKYIYTYSDGTSEIRGAIRVVSSDEVEFERGPNILLGKYTVDGERVRVVIMGTTVEYYKIIPDGLVEEKTGKIYYSKAGLAAAEEKRKRAEVERKRAEVERKRAEVERKRAEEEYQKAALARARRFKDNGNGTVTDTVTKLMWQRGEGGEMNWDSATAYCKNLSLAEYNDWRLPNIKELKSMFDPEGTEALVINKTYFPNAHCSVYWASSKSDYLWSRDEKFYFTSNGNDDFKGKVASGCVRCVRGGK